MTVALEGGEWSAAHPNSVGILGFNLPGYEVDHSPPSYGEVKKTVELCFSAPPVCIHGLDRDGIYRGGIRKNKDRVIWLLCATSMAFQDQHHVYLFAVHSANHSE